jgi:hypothetical protein
MERNQSGQTLAAHIAHQVQSLTFDQAQEWEYNITMAAPFLAGAIPIDRGVLRECQAAVRGVVGLPFFGLFSKMVTRQGTTVLKLTLKLNNQTVRSETEFHQFWPTAPFAAPVAAVVPVAAPLPDSCVGVGRDWMRTPPTSSPCDSENESPRSHLGDGENDWRFAEHD